MFWMTRINQTCEIVTLLEVMVLVQGGLVDIVNFEHLFINHFLRSNTEH